jgi:hypothetical protein
MFLLMELSTVQDLDMSIKFKEGRTRDLLRRFVYLFPVCFVRLARVVNLASVEGVQCKGAKRSFRNPILWKVLSYETVKVDSVG